MAMSADLGKTLEEFVTKLVATGRYHSKSEVLREGVRLRPAYSGTRDPAGGS
jgi:antitoxin ParD1/3/4